MKCLLSYGISCGSAPRPRRSSCWRVQMRASAPSGRLANPTRMPWARKERRPPTAPRRSGRHGPPLRHARRQRAACGRWPRWLWCGQRVAMQDSSNNTFYLLGDHLGSQAITANSSGTQVAEVRYKAWGENRHSNGTTPTSYHFTGQREESGLGAGVYFYGPRWYDPALGRFAQADTIVPEPGNPQSLHRYT